MRCKAARQVARPSRAPILRPRHLIALLSKPRRRAHRCSALPPGPQGHCRLLRRAFRSTNSKFARFAHLPTRRTLLCLWRRPTGCFTQLSIYGADSFRSTDRSTEITLAAEFLDGRTRPIALPPPLWEATKPENVLQSFSSWPSIWPKSFARRFACRLTDAAGSSCLFSAPFLPPSSPRKLMHHGSTATHASHVHAWLQSQSI